MRRIILLFIIISLTSCCAIGDPPIGDENSNDTVSFGKYNRWVINYLNQNTILFDYQRHSDLRVLEYQYHYQCAVFGDPGFYIKSTIIYEEDLFLNIISDLKKNIQV